MCYAIYQLKAIANRRGESTKTLKNMIRPHRHARLGLIGLLLPLGLSACSDTVAISDSPASSTKLQRHYEKTLSKAEQDAVISDLQTAAAKKEGEAKAEQAVVAGSTGTSN